MLLQYQKLYHCLSILSFAGVGILLSFFAPNISQAVDSPDPIEFQVNSFEIDGPLPIEQVDAHLLLDMYEGKSYNLDQLMEVATALENIIRDEGFAFYRVVVPPQSVSGNQVTLKIVEFTLKNVEVVGNQYFDEKNIKRSLPALKTSTSPNTEDLAHELKVANRHPDKNLKLTFRQSDSADSVNAQVEIEDNKPYKIILGLSNTGTPDTGEERVTASFQHTNVWKRDHIVTASYTTSPGHWSDVEQYGTSYSLPIYETRGWLTGYYVFSDVSTGVVADVFDISGSGTLWGISYLQNIPRVGRYEHWVGINYDNRLYENDIDFLGVPIGDDIRSTPITLSYQAEYPLKSSVLNFNVQWSTNIGHGGDNEIEDYESARFEADTYWDSFRASFNSETLLNDWRYTVNASGQYANEPLISGEQFGIGGSNTVRGYQERETAADVGYLMKVAAYTPEWENLTGVVFYDYGYGRQQSTLPGEDTSWNLASAGLGARWQWEEQLLVSMDLAQTLRDGPDTESDHWRLHVSLAWKVL